MVRAPHRAALAAMTVLLTLAACGPGSTPRRDVLLVLADSSEGHGAVYAALAQDGLVLRGGLRRADTTNPTPSPLELRIELYTGRRDEGHLDEPYEYLPHLPWAVGRTGRRLIGVTSEVGLVAEHGFDAAFADKLVRAPVAEVPELTASAIEELDAWAAERGHDRGQIFLVADLAGGAPELLEELLDRLEPELAPSFLLVYFTDPASPDRLMIVGPGLPKGERSRAVDPRDLYPTTATLARVPLPTILQGIDQLAE